MKEMTLVSIDDDAETYSVDVVLAANHFTDIDLIMAIREATAEFVQTEDGMKYTALCGGVCDICDIVTCIPERISLKHGWLYWKTVNDGDIVTVDTTVTVLPDDNEILDLGSDGKLVVWDEEESVPYVSDETLESFLGDDGLVNLSDIEVDRLMRRYPTLLKKFVKTESTTPR